MKEEITNLVKVIILGVALQYFYIKWMCSMDKKISVGSFYKKIFVSYTLFIVILWWYCLKSAHWIEFCWQYVAQPTQHTVLVWLKISVMQVPT